MRFCKKCVMPDTRPRLTYNSEGVCAACEWSEIKKNNINWEKRQNEFRELCDSFRGKQRYDCIVPASGGKDSTYVADSPTQIIQTGSKLSGDSAWRSVVMDLGFCIQNWI